MMDLGSFVNVSESNDIVRDAKYIIEKSQQASYSAVNTLLLARNWLLGKRICTEELKNASRSDTYGLEIIKKLSNSLTKEYGKGFTKSTLYNCYSFYKEYPDIFQTLLGKSSPVLTWSHYLELLRVFDKDARKWYEREAISQNWSTRTLQRNISTQYYYRLMQSQVKKPVTDEMVETTKPFQGDKLEFIKNPYVVEFLGLTRDASFSETKLESSILSNLQKFLLEMGKGYAFVARQQHIRTDMGDFFIDLVFYNYILKCFVLVDLKVGQITHQDVGQMDMYVRMYDDLIKDKADNPTLGIVLCSETSAAIAKYSILNGNDQLFASKYKLYLPTEEELKAEIDAQTAIFKLQHPDAEEGGE